MAFDELDGRHHLAVPRGLEKAHVFGVRVDDVHVLEVDALSGRASRGAARRSRDSWRRPPGAQYSRKKALPRCGYRFAFMIRFGGSP